MSGLGPRMRTLTEKSSRTLRPERKSVMTHVVSGRHWLVGCALRRYREGLGYRLSDVARILECDTSKVSRIETGQRGIRPKELRELLTEYGADPESREALLALVGPKTRDGWWEGYRAVLGGAFRDFLAAENAATSLIAYAPLQVPALLQTAEYARAVAVADTGVPEEAEELTVTATLTRQQVVLRERGVGFTALIGEAALRQEVGGESVLRSQLRYLAELADGQCPQVIVQVVPFTAGAQAAVGWGEFSVLRFGRVPAFGMVHLAGPAGGTRPEEPDAAGAYIRAFDCLRIFALDPAQSAHKIRQLADADSITRQ
jgi:transcriptional regulator with XRE-family HTH domain